MSLATLLFIEAASILYTWTRDIRD